MAEFCYSLNSRSVKILRGYSWPFPFHTIFPSCSFPRMPPSPEAVTCSGWRVQLTASTCGTIQCTNESQPQLGIEMQSWCCDSSTNRNNNHFSNYFPPFHFFSVGCMYFWGACLVWRDCLNFSVWDCFQKCSFLEEWISGFVLWMLCGSFNTGEYLFQSSHHWRGAMMCPVGAGSSCGLAQWAHSCFTAPRPPGCACGAWYP